MVLKAMHQELEIKAKHIITLGTHILCDVWALEPYAPNDKKECNLWSRTVNSSLTYSQLFFTYIGLLAKLVPKATYGDGWDRYILQVYPGSWGISSSLSLKTSSLPQWGPFYLKAN